MTEPYWWYVLYVRSNSESRVIKNMTQAFDNKGSAYELEAFCPQTEFFYRRKGHSGDVYRTRPMFPSYVFIETTMPAEEFTREFYDVIYHSTDIIRLLRNGGSKDIALSIDERRRFEYMLKGRRCVEHSEGYIVGDKITVTGGPLVGMEGCIKRINRHNRLAVIEVDMFNDKITATVALEIVSKE